MPRLQTAKQVGNLTMSELYKLGRVEIGPGFSSRVRDLLGKLSEGHDSRGPAKQGAAVVLVADGDADIAELLRLILEDEGHQVIRANDGEQAMMLALQHRPDLCVLDLELPHFDGPRATRLLRAADQTKATPVIMMSTGVRAERIAAGQEAGADAAPRQAVRAGRLPALGARPARPGARAGLTLGPRAGEFDPSAVPVRIRVKRHQGVAKTETGRLKMSWIVLLVLIAFMFAIAYALYTRTGSGINPRARRRRVDRRRRSPPSSNPQQEGEGDEFETARDEVAAQPGLQPVAAADHLEHDLVGAGADPVQAAVAVGALDLVLLHVAVAAVDLDALVRDVADQPRGEELRL